MVSTEVSLALTFLQLTICASWCPVRVVHALIVTSDHLDIHFRKFAAGIIFFDFVSEWIVDP